MWKTVDGKAGQDSPHSQNSSRKVASPSLPPPLPSACPHTLPPSLQPALSHNLPLSPPIAPSSLLLFRVSERSLLGTNMYRKDRVRGVAGGGTPRGLATLRLECEMTAQDDCAVILGFGTVRHSVPAAVAEEIHFSSESVKAFPCDRSINRIQVCAFKCACLLGGQIPKRN